ncbi:hypothetical protein MNBD_GAMMA22-3108 [hydrothermal vent metagenome]|uniref:Proposed lipoate regulatory protein YbeD n=1 Tax=hydrothermal vent metagenome TaxID=652676 RepID=A0A3B1B8A2_9ZZZZ
MNFVSDDTLFEFPCSFPIKIMGKDIPKLHQTVREIIQKHVENISDDAFKTRKSNKGTYISITVTITAKNKQQLDAIYLELTASQYVSMCL